MQLLVPQRPRKSTQPAVVSVSTLSTSVVFALGEGFWDGFCPAVLGFQNEFDYFAGGSVASGGVGGVVAGGFEFGGGVGYGYGESGALGEGDVGEVVADPGGFFFGDAGFLEALFEGGGFGFLA